MPVSKTTAGSRTTVKKTNKTSSKKSVNKTPNSDTTYKTSYKAPQKVKFDIDAFVFTTPVEVLEGALQARYEELEDLLEYQQPNSEQKKRISDLTYWLGNWELYLPEAKRRGMISVPTSAKECAILGLYTKPIKQKVKQK